MKEELIYPEGTKVKITDCKCGHEFEIGEIVTLGYYDEVTQDYEAHGDNDYWYIQEKEFELIKQNEQ